MLAQGRPLTLKVAVPLHLLGLGLFNRLASCSLLGVGLYLLGRGSNPLAAPLAQIFLVLGHTHLHLLLLLLDGLKAFLLVLVLRGYLSNLLLLLLFPRLSEKYLFPENVPVLWELNHPHVHHHPHVRHLPPPPRASSPPCASSPIWYPVELLTLHKVPIFAFVGVAMPVLLAKQFFSPHLLFPQQPLQLQ